MPINIYLGESLSIIPLIIPPQSIQCIITSPPWYGYGFSKESSDVQSFRSMAFSIFSNVLKEDGVVFWDTFSLDNDLSLLGEWNIIETIKWGISHIICFSKSKEPFLNNPFGADWDIDALRNPLIICQRCGMLADNTPLSRADNSWIVPHFCLCSSPYYLISDASFPVEIPERCLSIGSKKGDLILDPFCGSGTTGVACLKKGRNAILIDDSPKSCDMAWTRINMLKGKSVEI